MTRRMFSPEYLEPGAAPGRIRLVGARNGTYSAQVVVGTDRALANVKVVASELENAAGGTLPAESVSIFGMNPQPLGDISSLGEGRIVGSEMIEMGGGNSWYGDWSPPKTRRTGLFRAGNTGQSEPPPPRFWAGFNTSTGSPPRCRSGLRPIPANPIGCR